MSSTVDVECRGSDEERPDHVDTLTSSSSYSVITLKEPSPDQLSSHLAAPAQAWDSTVEQQQLNSTQYPPDDTQYPPNDTSSSPTDASVSAVVACVDTSSADDVVDGDDMLIVCVDHLEHKMTLRDRTSLQIVEHASIMYSYSPSFHCLPAIVESCRSDDAMFSDTSIASGEGYVADGAYMRSESCLSSPVGSLQKVIAVARRDDVNQRPLARDELSTSCDTIYSERPPHLEDSSLIVSLLPSGKITVVGGRQQLSAKSLSDGADSAVVCTPYSSQTSRDSTDTADIIHSTYYHTVNDVTNDEVQQSESIAVDERQCLVKCDDHELEDVAVSVVINDVPLRNSVGEDSDDEISVSSLKVEWEVGSDSETTKHSKPTTINAELLDPGTSLVHRPLSNVVRMSVQSFEASRDLWNDLPVTSRACCACVSCMIMRQYVSTLPDVIPTISIRLCSSIVDVICIVQRLIVVSRTWLHVVCDPASHLRRFCRSHEKRYGREAELAGGRAGTSRESDDVTGSLHQRRSISEDLENIREHMFEQLISVSDI